MTLNGIDVSNNNGVFDWAPWRGKIAFAFAKASEGNTFHDPDFARNWGQMKAEGIVRGAYHFLHPSVSGTAQAHYFLGIVDPQPGDLLCLDYEVTDGLPPEQCAAVAVAFADTVHTMTGAFPFTYVDQDFAAHYSIGLGMTPLWLANPSRVPVSAIGQWKLVSIEQTGQRGVDVDVFYGDLAELGRLAIPHPVPKPPVPHISQEQAKAAIAGIEGDLAQLTARTALLAAYAAQG